MNRWMGGWMDGSVDGWVSRCRWLSRWMDGCVCVGFCLSTIRLISQHPFIIHPHITTSIHHTSSYLNIHSLYILIGNNLTFLRSVFRNPVFRGGTYSTKFIPQQYPDGFHGVSLSVEGTVPCIGLHTILYDAAGGGGLSN